MRVVTYRAPNLVFTEHEFELPLDHAQPGGPRSPSSRARSSRRARARRPAVAGLPPGRPRVRSASPAQADRRQLVGARAPGLPAAAPRPARHGPLDARRGAPGLTRRRAGRVPDPLPGRLDRAGRRARPRSELGVEKWSVLGQSFGGFCVADLPLPGARGPARGVRHRRAAAAGRHADDVYRATYERTASKNARLLRALPRGSRARSRHRRAARGRGRAAALGRPADRPALPPGRARARDELRRRDGPLHRRARPSARLRSCTTSTCCSRTHGTPSTP